MRFVFWRTTKKQDRNRVFGQSTFPVLDDLLSLEFKVDIKNAQYICRSCVQLLKKGRGLLNNLRLLNNLHRLNCTIQENYIKKSSDKKRTTSKNHLTKSQRDEDIAANSAPFPTRTYGPVEIDYLDSHDCVEYSSSLINNSQRHPHREKKNSILQFLKLFHLLNLFHLSEKRLSKL